MKVLTFNSHSSSFLNMAPRPKKSHRDALKELCIICLKKEKVRPISEAQKAVISRHIYPHYEAHSGHLPRSICIACRCILVSLPSNTPRPLPPLPHYSQMVEELRHIEPGRQDCSCDLCLVARWVFRQGKRPQSKYLPLPESPPIPPAPPAPLSGAAGSSSLSTQGPGPSTPVKKLLCPECFAEVSRLEEHECRGRGERTKNLEQRLTPRSSDHFAAQHIRNRVESSGSRTLTLSNVHGRPTEVTAAPHGARAKRQLYRPPPLDHSTMFALQDTASNMSDKALKEQARVIRQAMGNRRAVQPGLREAMAERGKKLSPFFETRRKTFQVRDEKGNMKPVEKDIVVVKNPTEFVNFVKEERGREKVRVKVGIDGGGGFVKACMGVISDSVPHSPTSSPVAKKPPTPIGGERFKETGVKKLMIIGIGQGIPENHQNMRTFMSELQLGSLSFCLATDLKLSNILAGLMSHASSFPCTWCDASKSDIRQDIPGPLRTFGSIRERAGRYKKAIADWKRVGRQMFFGCVELPLLENPDQEEVLDAIAPPELHLMLGVVAKLFDELTDRMQKELGSTAPADWARHQNKMREQYRGGTLEGNQCRLLLRKSLDLTHTLPDKFKAFGVVLHRFNEVVNSCFGMEVAGNPEQKISDFKQAYFTLPVSITPKVHAVFDHVPQWLHRQEAKVGRKVGLGYATEQASEAVHRDFKQRWEGGFKIGETREEYKERLLRCVVRYNGGHL